MPAGNFVLSGATRSGLEVAGRRVPGQHQPPDPGAGFAIRPAPAALRPGHSAPKIIPSELPEKSHEYRTAT